MNPGAQLSGFSVDSEENLIGSGSIVLQGVNIGRGVTIPAGSVVFSHVADSSTLIGNPSRRMKPFVK